MGRGLTSGQGGPSDDDGGWTSWSDTKIVGDDGAIEWGRLASILIGVVALPVFSGAADLISTLFDLSFLQPIDRLTGAVSGTIRSGGDTAVQAMQIAWENALDLVESLGPVGFVFALILVLATAYVAARAGGDDE